jgi:tRNA(fMet)-specific endonuclease VapC
MSGKRQDIVPDAYLLDTSVAIPYIRLDLIILAYVARVTRVWLCSIVLGDRYRGALNSGRPLENLQRLEQIIARNEIIPCDAATARLYGEIKQLLIRRGRPIPENDIWIAAIARQHGFTLATRDSDFQHVDDLVTEDW